MLTKLFVLIPSLSLIACGESGAGKTINSCAIIDNNDGIDDTQAFPAGHRKIVFYCDY